MEKNRKKSWFVRFFAWLMVGVLLTPALCVRAEGDTDLIDQVDHTDEYFEDLEYYDVTEADFDAVVANLEEITADADNADEVDALIDEMEDVVRKVLANDVIANVYATLDANNTTYNDLVTEYEELAVALSDKLMQCYQIIAYSECSEVLHARMDDEDEWQEILDYIPMTDEQKELSNLETELSLKYDELYIAEYDVTINGVTYNEDSLSEAYDAGEVDFGGYLMGLARITEQRNQALGELFLELVDVRTQIAKSYGYDNYAEYAYIETYDREYMPEDLEEYREQVIEYIVPVEMEIYELMFDDSNTSYRDMWNQEMSEEECLANLERYLPEISEDMMISYNYMIDHHMYDLSVDDKKAPGGYTTSIYTYNAPYMFNCADGTISDMNTLIHEFGHYNEMYFASEDEWNYTYNNLDVAEIHSQGLELLFLDYGEELYGDFAYAVKLYTLFNMTYACVEGVKEDEFQYMIYSNPDGLTIEKLNEMYYDVCEKYGSLEFYNSYYLGMYGCLDTESIYEWVEIPHTFQSPLYYVSYSVSMAAVEELWNTILDDRQEGIDTYLKIVQMGMVDDFSVVLDTVGLNNPIENPRFDVYAGNIRYYLGLQDNREGSTPADGDDVVIEDYEDDDDEDEDVEDEDIEDEEEEEEDDDDDDDDSSSRRPRKDDNGLDIVKILIIAGIIVAVVIVIIVVIILIASKKKKAKMAENAVSMQNVPPMMPNQQPMQNVPPMMPNQQPMQNVPPMMPNQQPMQNVPPMMPNQQPVQNQEQSEGNGESKDEANDKTGEEE